MKLKFSDRCEQGTPDGVMLFRKGAEYAVTQNGGKYTVQHEPRMVTRRVDGKRVTVPESKTVIDKALLDKLVAFGPAKLQE